MMLSIDTWWKKREMWKRILKARGIEIDSSDELDRFITNMDMILHAQQCADATSIHVLHTRARACVHDELYRHSISEK